MTLFVVVAGLYFVFVAIFTQTQSEMLLLFSILQFYLIAVVDDAAGRLIFFSSPLIFRISDNSISHLTNTLTSAIQQQQNNE